MALLGLGKQQRTVLRAVKSIETFANRGDTGRMTEQRDFILSWLDYLTGKCEDVNRVEEDEADTNDSRPEPVPTAEVAPVLKPNKRRPRKAKKTEG